MIKLQCQDGVVRDFFVAHCDGDLLPNGTRSNGSSEAGCNECGKLFGVHDTKVLKPRFRDHICEVKAS